MNSADKRIVREALRLIEDVLDCESHGTCNFCLGIFHGNTSRQCLQGARKAASVIETAFRNELIDYDEHYDEDGESKEGPEEDESRKK